MTDPRPFEQLTDDELGGALRQLGRALALPSRAATLAPATTDGAAIGVAAGADPARLARSRIEAEGILPAASSARPLSWLGGRSSGGLRRPARRGLVLGLAAVVAVAAVAGAIGFGLPGIRIVFGPSASPPVIGSVGPSRSPSRTIASPTVTATRSTSPGPLGSGLGLGTPLAVADAGDVAGITLRLPPDPPYGDPVSTWNLDGRISLVWPVGPDLPALREPGIGLILGQFRGSIDPGYFEKVLGPGTEIDPVLVNDETGWWISGEAHELVFVNPSGIPVFDSHRIVGDTLIWTVGEVTYRLESGLGRQAAIRLAESLR